MLRERVALLGRPLILDGGMATTLEHQGCNVQTALWSACVLVEREDAVAAVHGQFAQCGCDVLSTCTYQCTYEGYERHMGLDAQAVTAVLHGAVRLARDNSGGGDDRKENAIMVAASVGPYGAYLANGAEYRGDYDLGLEGFKAFHRRRVMALWEASPDFMLFETIPNVCEARALLSLLEEVPTMRAVFSFQCRDERSLANGDPFEEAVVALSRSPQVLGVGVNCLRAALVLPLFMRVRHLLGPHQVFVAYPNGGGRWDAESKVWHAPEAQESDELLRLAEQWKAEGVGIIGGCCQVGPDMIARLVQRLA